MKRWALLTVACYAVIFIILTVPVIYWCAADWDLAQRQWWRPRFSERGMAEVFRFWGYWVWLGVMLVGQALLLLVPMDIAQGRPVSRRKLLVPVITTAFFFANLVFAGGFCLLFSLYGDEAPDKILFWTNFGLPESVTDPVEQQAGKFFGGTLSAQNRTVLGALSILLLLWSIWALLFYRFARRDDPQRLTRRLLNWLLKGSILEFLIAVPSHIVVRGRNDCCAPAGTFWGIATGLSIMLLCFGPGIFFLFVERFQRLRPRNHDD
jgi:hypothetical protein